MPFRSLLLVATALTTGGDQPSLESPRAVLRQATTAVEGGRTRQAEAAWQMRLRTDSTDAAALYGLGSLARLSYAYPAAMEWFARVRTVPPARRGRFEAFSILGEAQVLWVTARYSESGARYVDALHAAREARDVEAEALALHGLASVRIRTNELEGASATFDSAARLIPAGDIDLRAAHRCAHAALLVRTSPKEALTEARAGARLARRAGDRRREANCLHIRAQAESRLGDLPGAMATLDSVIGRLRRLHERSGLASALQWSGYLAFSRTDFVRAQELLGQAIVEAEQSASRSALAWSLLNLGQVSIELSDPVSASGLMERSLALMRAIGDEWGATTALGFIGRLAFTLGQTERAESIWTDLVARARAATDAEQEAGLEYGLAAIAMQRRDWEGAAGALDRRRAALLRGGRPASESEWRYDWGVLALKRGDAAEARRLLQGSLDAADSTAHLARYYIESRLAEADLRLGDTLGAERRLVSATDQLETWRATLSDSALRVLAFQVLDDFGDKDPATAPVIAATAAAGRIGSAFAIAERRRARDLRDQMARTEATASSRIRGGRGSPASQSSHLSVDSVAAALPGRSALLEYVTGSAGEPTTLVLISRESRRSYQLSPLDSLLTSISRFVALLESGLADSVTASALGEALLGPAVADLPRTIEHLVLVPEGALYRIPFAALRVGGRRIIERYTLQVAPAAAVAAALWTRPASRLPLRVLAFADPAFPPSDRNAPPVTRAHFAAFAVRGGLLPLPASVAEARSAAALAPGAVLRLRGGASESYLKQAPLDRFRVIHFATHAVVDERAIGRSGIALAPGGGEDGFVTAGDLAALRLRADLVILSGCGTGSGVIVGGEGLRGLTAPLLQAGARAVLATLWPVSDRTTAAFVSRFYRWVGTGLSTADALRRAQLDAAQDNQPPRVWAGFVLAGNGFVRLAAPDG